MPLHGQQQQQSLRVNCVLEFDFIHMPLALLEEAETEGNAKEMLEPIQTMKYDSLFKKKHTHTVLWKRVFQSADWLVIFYTCSQFAYLPLLPSVLGKLCGPTG